MQQAKGVVVQRFFSIVPWKKDQINADPAATTGVHIWNVIIILLNRVITLYAALTAFSFVIAYSAVVSRAVSTQG